MKTIKAINLIFDDGQYIPLEARDIGAFYMGDITSTVRRVLPGEILEQSITPVFAIEIFDTAYNRIFDLESEAPITIADKLLDSKTILGVELIYEDDTFHPVMVVWDEFNDTFNSNEDILLADNGHIYIVISENDTVESMFKDCIDDSMYAEKFKEEVINSY